eukprot:CAMPEP_0170364554 /NCGR_PEP_ID=MMETSP0117_2-20130122/5435_1 /TAXON_ID=400756 /ORGANISM="Durinskia baltica, Strain CSIRO CS-38" /LENGTH=139 /DNA_ID=CAMNT_0010619061 /DNA_START=103 /DNA_END=522 /DNA_ORIENTATION=-
MATSLIKHERITTTTQKAKELRKVAEKLITHAKKGGDHSYNLAAKVVREKPALVKLFEILGPRYEFREGGYTRICKLNLPRQGDSADMCYIEYIDREGELRKPRPPNPKGSLLIDMMYKMGNIMSKKTKPSAVSQQNKV